MSLTLKQKILKAFSPVVFPLVKLYWRVWKPKTFGVKVIVQYGNSFLLIRNAYGYGRWTFPGGGIATHEDNIVAGIREVREETGLEILQVQPVGSIISTAEEKIDTISILHGYATDQQTVFDEFEIAEGQWFQENDFPDLSPVAQTIWAEHKKRNRPPIVAGGMGSD